MNAHLNTPALVAMAVLLSVVATSCSGDDPGPGAAPTSSPTASPSKTPDASPTPTLSQTEQAAQDVENVVRRYFAVTDQLGQNPELPLRRLQGVAADMELTIQRDLLRDQRSSGEVQIGNLRVVELKVQRLSLDNPPAATVEVCWDVADVDIVDANGDSTITAARSDRGWTQLTVTNIRGDQVPRNGWRVTGGLDQEKSPCAG